MYTLSNSIAKTQQSSYIERVKIKINILKKYVAKDEESLQLMNQKLNDPRIMDVITEENLQAYLRTKKLVADDIADYKQRISDLEDQLK